MPNSHRTRSPRVPALPVAAVMMASLACSLVARSSPTPEATPAAEPTAVSAARSAQDVLELAVPAAIGGIEVVITSLKGDELDPQAMAALAETYGVDPAQIELAMASAPDESGMSYQAGVIRVPGRNWAAVLDALAEMGAAGFGATVEWVEMGGRRILKAQSADDPALPAVHHASLGDAVYYVQSSDAGAVESSVEAVPDEEGQAGSDGWQPPVPGTFPLLLTIVERPQAPVCVGEPAEWLKVMAIDTGLGVPYPYTTFSVTGRLMEAPSQGLQSGPMVVIPYAAERYGVDGREEVRVDAVALMGGLGQATLSFDVQHCLYGTWQDGERVVRITPPFGDTVTAEVIEGTLCGAEGGIDFSGVLDGDQLTGDTLTVCNPDECVDPGLLPPSATVPFTARVADDGWSVDFDWTGDFYTFEEDSSGKVVACTKTSTEEHQFTITRLTFGE